MEEIEANLGAETFKNTLSTQNKYNDLIMLQYTQLMDSLEKSKALRLKSTQLLQEALQNLQCCSKENRAIRSEINFIKNSRKTQKNRVK